MYLVASYRHNSFLGGASSTIYNESLKLVDFLKLEDVLLISAKLDKDLGIKLMERLPQDSHLLLQLSHQFHLLYM